MFQSVSGHTSEQSIANYSSRPTVSQLQGVFDTISNWFKNHQQQRTQISTFTNVPIVQNSNRMASSVYHNPKFSESIFSTPAIFKATSKLFGSQGCSDDKNWLDFPSISLRFVDFAVQLCFRCEFSFREKRLLSQVWQWRDHNSLLHIATNETAAFCIDNRLRQMAFFRVRQSGQRPAFELWWKILK